MAYTFYYTNKKKYYLQTSFETSLRLIIRKPSELTGSDFSTLNIQVLNSGGKPRLQVEYKNEEKPFTSHSVPLVSHKGDGVFCSVVHTVHNI